jgi:hypothetical protein
MHWPSSASGKQWTTIYRLPTDPAGDDFKTRSQGLQSIQLNSGGKERKIENLPKGMR